jgi:hypothetical protein
MSDEYIPELFHAREENLRLARELRAEREQHHELKISNAKKEVLSAADIDHPIVEAMLDNGKPRVVDGKVVIDYGDGRVGTPQEAMQFWRDNPQQFGNVVAIKPKREPTAQEKHLAWLQTLTPDQYNAYRRKYGRAYLDPPAE